MSELDLALQEFLVESLENLDQLDRDLIAIEKNADCGGALNSIFRTFHTIKGTCGFFDFPGLEALAHAAESLLSDLREGRLQWTGAMAAVLLDVVDVVRKHLDCIGRRGSESPLDQAPILAALAELRLPPHAGAVAVAAGPAKPLLSPSPSIDSPSVPEPPEDLAGSGPGDGTIRVDVSVLDVLMNLVGELVLTRNQIFRSKTVDTPPSIQQAAQRLNLITSELQEGVMRTRMQPIGNLWNRFPRVVRDLALDCRKRVRIEMSGKSTGLDKTILEAIKDPLTHLIRNAIDHGIEPPESRIAVGKPAEGTIHLRAYHEGGMANIEIQDDGAGITPARIREKSRERGLITAEQALRIDDAESLRLIFRPGFSTAASVTSVSGRGVGMDVVKTNVERIGGSVDLQSTPGKGTTFRIKIPLTLAIIPALIVTCGGDRYAIPQVSLLELVRLEGEDGCRKIEWIRGVAFFRLRGELLSLVDLDRLLGVGPGDQAGSIVNIVVLQADNRRFGLIVAEISDTEEIVVKPLARQLKQLPLFSGTTIMGDGRVALILDILGIARTSGMGVQKVDAEQARLDPVAEAERSFLLIGLGDGSRMALPLAAVARLEEIEAGAVETAAGREVVQYRGRILPLVRLSERFAGVRTSTSPLQVVIASDGGRDVGCIVEEILDIVRSSPEVQDLGKGPGILGTAVLQRRVTALLDVPSLIHESAMAR